MLIAGLLGALLAALVLLVLPLSVSVELRTGEPGVARAGILGLSAVYRRRRRPGAPRRPGTGGLPMAAGEPSMQRSLRALGKLLEPLRALPLSGTEVALRGGTGDAAATGLLYGIAWAAISALLALSSTVPQRLSIEPRLEGPPSLSAEARAQLRIPLWRILLGGTLAVREILRRKV